MAVKKEEDKMWFRLKEDYETHEDEIHRESWGIGKIKKGAPVTVGLIFDPKGQLKPDFIFSSGGLHHLILSMLELPNSCVKSYDGDVFCATKQEFFYASYDRSSITIAKQLFHCPLCGQELKEQPTFPREEKSETFEVKLQSLLTA